MYWIKSPVDVNGGAITFSKTISLNKEIVSAVLEASAMGLYEALLDGKKIGDRVLTPGFTSYHTRIQYQSYDVSGMLKDGSILELDLADGWAVGHFGFVGKKNLYADHPSAYAHLQIVYLDGSEEHIYTDESWDAYTHEVTFASIYDGETVDKTHLPTHLGKAVSEEASYNLVADCGEPIVEHEILYPTFLVTPKGERVLDFHQNMTGYVSLDIKGKRGDRVCFSCAEVLDKDGNFYNDNYRMAQNRVTYILSGEQDHFKPRFSFQGFRYIRLDEYPFEAVDVDGFRAIVVHSAMKRIGRFSCGNAKINQLYHNLIWGQKSNYLDIPTDCPQRDERLGWTGDAQVFCRAAALNYDVRKFFDKWLADLRLEQREDGAIFGTCPETNGMHRREHSRISAGWGDAATIIPWTLYQIYGDKQILADNFDMMCRWVDYMHADGPEEYLWLGAPHFGDWLAMDAGGDTYEGATSKNFIGSAFYAYSAKLVVMAGEILGRDVTAYRELAQKVLAAFREKYMKDGMAVMATDPEGSRDTVRSAQTQTGISLILQFGLCTEAEREPLAKRLEELIGEFGGRMCTGFIGTPYLLHALSSNGRADVAYQLLFNEDNPSWLYSVNHGATTIWEHWNGIKEDGSFWSTDMNSFNHYAYGAVGDWLYGVAAGIQPTKAGFEEITLAPVPDRRMGYVDCALDTLRGRVESHWYYRDGALHFEFSIPRGVTANVILPNGAEHRVSGGIYHYTVKE